MIVDTHGGCRKRCRAAWVLEVLVARILIARRLVVAASSGVLGIGSILTSRLHA